MYIKTSDFISKNLITALLFSWFSSEKKQAEGEERPLDPMLLLGFNITAASMKQEFTNFVHVDAEKQKLLNRLNRTSKEIISEFHGSNSLKVAQMFIILINRLVDEKKLIIKDDSVIEKVHRIIMEYMFPESRPDIQRETDEHLLRTNRSSEKGAARVYNKLIEKGYFRSPVYYDILDALNIDLAEEVENYKLLDLDLYHKRRCEEKE